MAGEKGNYWSSAILGLLFNGTPIANIADNAAASPLTNLFLALHTADPGAPGNQATSEVAYTGYVRAQVSRTTGGWTLTAQSISPAAMVSWAPATGGNATAAFFSIGTNLSGAGNLLYAGPLTPAISISAGVTPQLQPTSTITEA